MQLHCSNKLNDDSRTLHSDYFLNFYAVKNMAITAAAIINVVSHPSTFKFVVMTNCQLGKYLVPVLVREEIALKTGASALMPFS